MSSIGSSFSGFADEGKKPKEKPVRTYAHSNRGSSFMLPQLELAQATVRDKVLRAQLVPPAPHTSTLANRVAGYQKVKKARKDTLDKGRRGSQGKDSSGTRGLQPVAIKVEKVVTPK